MGQEERDEQCHSHAKKLEEMKVDVKELRSVVPEIKVLLERSLNLQEGMRDNEARHVKILDVMQGLTGDITRIRSQELSAINVELARLQGEIDVMESRISVLEESKKGALTSISGVAVGLVVALISGATTIIWALTHQK